MFGVIGEHNSDVATLKVLVRRLAKNDSIQIKTKGYSGCAEMLRKGAQQLSAYCALGCKKLIICYDSDGASVDARIRAVQERIVLPAQLSQPYLVVVPVQELEAWILADIKAVTKVFPSWRPKEIISPELINSPKEHLEKLSRDSNRIPRYSHATHNERVAQHLNLNTISKKCSSFRDLMKFVCEKKKQNS